MGLNTIVCFVAAVATLALAGFVLYRDPRAFVHRILAAGLALFALEAGFTGLGLEATSASSFMRWNQARTLTASFLPLAWLVFSLSFARVNYREFLERWKWILIVFAAVPAGVGLFFSGEIFVKGPLIDQTGAIFLRLGWAGYTLYLLMLIGAVLIVMNLERTLRTSTGRTRWQVKFMVFGVGSFFGILIYTDSQVLLYRVLDVNLEVVKAGILLLGNLFILTALTRAHSLKFDFYVSHTFLYNSLSLLLVGIYFILVGVLARLIYYWKGAASVPIVAFILFAALIGLSVLFLSDRVRLLRKRFISRHFKRPFYDYQRIWSDFTQKTAALTGTRELGSVIVRMVSETLDALSVTMWLVDEQGEHLHFCASTVFSEAEAAKLKIRENGAAALIKVMQERTKPVHVAGSTDKEMQALRENYRQELNEARIKYCVPLNAAGRFVGVLTVSDRVGQDVLSSEGYDLLKTIADQAAANLLSLRLAEHLQQARQLEAFQMMSAFFMHDLKNLASKLSLVTQNLPVHFDNPEFRDDALRTVSQSVAKINNMCTRLSLLSQRLEVRPRQIDVNRFVSDTLSSMDGYLKTIVVRELGDVPPSSMDPEQMQKVLVNLLMNAHDAVTDGGEIKVATSYHDGWVEIAVRDNGCGMSREFIEKHLFKPFQTTKKTGMGIGLFHCKTIVEAHGGRIEVASEEGKGTTFRVLLPARPAPS